MQVSAVIYDMLTQQLASMRNTRDVSLATAQAQEQPIADLEAIIDTLEVAPTV